MAKVKVKVVGAYVDGHTPGSEIEVERKSAEYLEKVGYVQVLAEVKPEPKPEPKKAPAKKSK